MSLEEQKYQVIDEENIKGFFGSYGWLSNYYYSPVTYKGIVYPTAENAYQSAKADYSKHIERDCFKTCTPSQAKAVGKTTADFKRKEWDRDKFVIMSLIIHNKFSESMFLGNMLFNTGERYLEETNHWNDIYWGIDYLTGRGQNNLGKILMAVRKILN